MSWRRAPVKIRTSSSPSFGYVFKTPKVLHFGDMEYIFKMVQRHLLDVFKKFSWMSYIRIHMKWRRLPYPVLVTFRKPLENYIWTHIGHSEGGWRTFLRCFWEVFLDVLNTYSYQIKMSSLPSLGHVIKTPKVLQFGDVKDVIKMVQRHLLDVFKKFSWCLAYVFIWNKNVILYRFLAT